MKTCPQCGTDYPDDAAFCSLDRTPLTSATPNEDLIGTTVADRYRILRLLGAGGMGRVYLAEHVLMGRMSAVKVMGKGLAGDPDAQSRFTREAANASRINHPNVCAVYDFGPTGDGAVYLAMEYIEGETLRDILERERVLPLQRALNLVRQCAAGLQAAHQLGIVHRDLKPDNIMVVPGSEETAKIVDFGVARAFGPEGEAQRVTRTGLVVGTPEYMSPEQLAGDAVDSRADVYALALVLYRALTGVHPFAADSAQATLSRRLTEDAALLAEVRPDVAFPEGLQAVLSQGLSRDRKARFGTAGEMAQALDDLGHAPAGATVAPATRDLAAEATVVLDSAEGQPPAEKRSRMGSLVTALVVFAVAVSTVYALRAPLLGRGPGDEASTVIPPATVPQAAQGAADGLATGQNDGRGSPDSTGEPRGSDAPAPANAPATQRPDPETTNGELMALQDSIIAFPARRGDFRRRAAAIFEDRNLPDSLRVTAAWTVAQAYTEEAEDSLALGWYRSALELVPAENAARRARLREIITQLEPQSP